MIVSSLYWFYVIKSYKIVMFHLRVLQWRHHVKKSSLLAGCFEICFVGDRILYGFTDLASDVSNNTTGWLAGWIAGCLAVWMIRFHDMLADQILGWLADFLARWIAGWLAGRLTGQLAGRLAGWLTVWLAGWLVGWLNGWLVGWSRVPWCQLPLKWASWGGTEATALASFFHFP